MNMKKVNKHFSCKVFFFRGDLGGVLFCYNMYGDVTGGPELFLWKMIDSQISHVGATRDLPNQQNHPEKSLKII